MKKVTVIMPAYNHENFIGESIESVLAQTYENIELIVLNDGSTDHTKSVIEDFAAHHSNIRFIDKPNNEGTVAALNDLIEAASGEYIIWLSSDDLQYPYTVEKLMNCMEQNPGCNLVFGGVTMIDKDGNKFGEYVVHNVINKYYFHNLSLKHNVVCGPTILVNKICYRTTGPFDARFRYAHDYHMWLRLFADNDVIYIDEPLAKNREYPGQITSLGRNEVDALRVLFDTFQNTDIMTRYLARIGIEYSETVIVRLIKELGNYVLSLRMQEKKEYLYRIKKYILNRELPGNLKATLLKQKKFFEAVVGEDAPVRLTIDKNAINCGFLRIANDLELDGILINKEAIRYHLIDPNTAESFYKKVMPHDNTLFTAQICESDLECIATDFIFFDNIKSKKSLYNIGLTSFMAQTEIFQHKLVNVRDTMITLNFAVFREITEINISGSRDFR